MVEDEIEDGVRKGQGPCHSNDRLSGRFHPTKVISAGGEMFF